MLAEGIDLAKLVGGALPAVGGVSIVGILVLLFRIALALTRRGDTRDEAQWKRMEAELRRKDEEIERLQMQSSEWYHLWQRERGLHGDEGIDP